jgi:hypothetical protein
MPVYRAGFASATPASAANYASFNSATRKALIREIDLSLLTAVQSQVGLGVPANEATPPVVSTSITPVGRPSDIAATARIGTAWSTAPTVPSVFEEQIVLAATIGAGWVWKWAPDEYIEVKIAGWRTIWNSGGSTSGQLLINVLYEE